MQFVPWIALVAGCLIAGAAFVGVLVVHRAGELFVAAVGACGLGLSVWGFTQINEVYSPVEAVLYAFALGLGSLIGGYALASALLDKLARNPRPHRSRRPDIEPSEDRVAVALFSCTEPECYSPSVTARELNSLIEEGLLDVGIGVMPFMFTAQKARYRAAGGRSPAYDQLSRVADRLETELSNRGVRVHAEAAACAGAGSLPDAVRSLAERGFGTVVVAPYAVSDSLSMDSAMRLVDAMRLGNEGVNVAVAEPLWGSDALPRMIAQRVLGASAAPEKTGVVLVAHGQPDAKDLSNPAFDEQEITFLNRVRMEISEGGVPAEHVKIAWSEWQDPDVTNSVRHLAALGCSRILVVPAVYPVESIGTVLDLPMAVRQARVDEWVSIVVLPAWRDDPVAIQALEGSIERALRGDTAEA